MPLKLEKKASKSLNNFRINYHGKMEIITHTKHSYRKRQNLFTVFPLINAPDAYLVSEP